MSGIALRGFEWSTLKFRSSLQAAEVSMVGYFFQGFRGRRKFAGCGRAAATAALVGCLLVLATSGLSAEPAKAKAKEVTTKQSSVAALKSEAPAVSSPAANAAVDPAVCAKPEDAGASPVASSPVASSDEKPSVAAPASANEAETSDSSVESKADFMKDKLKLSLGGKSGSTSDQPQQCGIDEAKEK
jgi:hypothetical protein